MTEVSYGIALVWMSLDFSDDKKTLVQVIAWHQVITWANVDSDLCRHMASPGHSVLSPRCVIVNCYHRGLGASQNAWYEDFPDSKFHGANMGPIWGRQDPDGPTLAPWTLLSGSFSFHDAIGV